MKGVPIEFDNEMNIESEEFQDIMD